MKNMKKIVAMLLAVMMIASLCACNSNLNKTNTLTYNGITKTETTSTVNGQSTTTVEYTDADGNVLDPAIGEAAFELAKNGDKNALENAMAAQATEAPAEEAEAPAEEAAQEEATLYTASIAFDNETEGSITALYMSKSDDTSWGENVLGDEPLEDGTKVTFHDALTFAPDSEWDLKFVTEDGEEHEAHGFTFEGMENAETITFTFTMDADGYHISID